MDRMHHSRTPAARDVPRSIGGQNLDHCGFECPGCGYQHRLSESIGGILLGEIFRTDVLAHAVLCPECGVSTSFTRSNLKLFGGTGED